MYQINTKHYIKKSVDQQQRRRQGTMKTLSILIIAFKLISTDNEFTDYYDTDDVYNETDYHFEEPHKGEC
jgi:hypothetical protein